ncbi:MAG: hypothetical protein IJ901_05060 [Bacteroidaceae bacterium]|nr:hypothetical protein [Bacteroidaceae bacterium]
MNKLFLFVLAFVLITSCSNGVEKDAKQQMEKTMKELAKDPSSAKISDVKTMFANDSLCILHFRFSAKNGFGAMRTSLCEYIYLVHDRHSGNEKRRESVIDLDDKDSRSVLDIARDHYDEKFLETDSISSLKNEDRKAWHIYMAANMHMIFGGRTVGKDRYDIDNW